MRFFDGEHDSKRAGYWNFNPETRHNYACHSTEYIIVFGDSARQANRQLCMERFSAYQKHFDFYRKTFE